MVSFAICTANLQKTPKSPMGSKEIKPVNPKGNQPWIFIGRTYAEAPILWPLDVKSRLIGKDLDAGKDKGQEQKGTTKEEMVRWHHQLNGHGFEQILGDSVGQGSLVGNSPWDCSPYDLADWTTNTTTTHPGVDILVISKEGLEAAALAQDHSARKGLRRDRGWTRELTALEHCPAAEGVGVTWQASLVSVQRLSSNLGFL